MIETQGHDYTKPATESQSPNAGVDETVGLLPLEDAGMMPSNSELTMDQLENAASANWWSRHKAKVYIGAAAAGLTGTVVGIENGSFDDVAHSVVTEAPWAAGALIASESLFVAGVGGMAVGAGRAIGNPLHLRGRLQETLSTTASSPAYRVGLAVNTIGALGTAGVVAVGAIEALPPETWPGALGLAAADVASTIALRAGAYKAMSGASEKAASKESAVSIKVRNARPEDIDRLADIDLELFDSAYGAKKPTKQEVVTMLSKRLANCPEGMFVAVLNGEVEGFISTFRTNKPAEEFKSWEDSTNNGTLDGKVDPNGKYGYVTNLTVRPAASKAGAKEMLFANLFVYGIESGVDYGYFESRMPQFKKWLDQQKEEGREVALEGEGLAELAHEYMNLRREDGKRYDSLLRMYEGYGFELSHVVADAFEDEASLNFGVVCKAQVPPMHQSLKKVKLVRQAYANALRLIAKSPKLIEKVL